MGPGGQPSLKRHPGRHHGHLPGSGSRDLSPPPVWGHPARPQALLAFNSLKNRHTITLHPLDHNPHRWMPEDDATAAITIQQDPGNPAGYHLTWDYPAQHPPASPTLQDFLATISAELQEAEATPQPDDEMSQAPSPPTAQKSPHKEPLTHPITKVELHPQHRTTPDSNGFRDLPREWQSTTARSGGTKSHRGSKPSASTHSRTPQPPGHYRRTATTSSSPSKGMPPSHQRKETPYQQPPATPSTYPHKHHQHL